MSIIKPYTAEADIEGYRLVTFGTEEGSVKAAAAATDIVIGRTCFCGAVAGTTVDIDHGRYGELKLGGTVARGDELTAGADGCAVKAESGNKIAGIALEAGVKDDVIHVLMK